MIVVFDSGVWISALNFAGTPRSAIDSASSSGATIGMCVQIADEIHRILQAKFDWRIHEVDNALGEFASDLRYFAVSGSIRGVCRDPNDDMVLECAIVAGAELIVTGDKDLLAIGNYEGVRIVTPRTFLDEFERTI